MIQLNPHKDTIDKENYTKDEVLEVVRQCLFYGEPEYWEKGGCNGVINFPPNGTYAKAKKYFNKYYLKNDTTTTP